MIMPSFNSGHFVLEAIESVLAQTFPDFEVIVIDDASTDTSPEAIDSFDDSRIVVLHNASRMGASESRNRGIAIARGNYVAILDADDAMTPDRLAKQVSFLDSHPECGAVVGGYRKIDVEGRVLRNDVLPPTTHTGIALGLRWGPTFSHGTLIVRRKLLDDVGGYSGHRQTAEDYGLYGELLKTGCTFGSVPCVVLLSRETPGSLSSVHTDVGRRNKQHTVAMIRQLVQPPSFRHAVRAGLVEPMVLGAEPRLRYAKLLYLSAVDEYRTKNVIRSMALFSACSIVTATLLPRLALSAATTTFATLRRMVIRR